MSSIIDIIKNFLKRNKVKALPETTRTSKRINFLSNNSNFVGTELTENISKFLSSYEQLLKPFSIYEQGNFLPSAYQALVTMNGIPMTQEQYSKDFLQEKDFIHSLENNRFYTLQSQGDQDNPAFYHIKSSNYHFPNYENLIRIYLNCDSGNIAELAQSILSINQNSNFYLKFSACSHESKIPRGEKIVLYCDDNNYSYYVQLLQYIKQVRPDLFKESENVLPFLQKANNFMSISRQPISNMYTNLNSQSFEIPHSTNSFISNIFVFDKLKVDQKFN